MRKGIVFSGLSNPQTIFANSNKIVDGYYDTDDYIEDELNSLSFRSDEFANDHDGKHILFAGCSETFGCGDSLNKVWSYMLYKKISETTRLSGYYSIGLPGAGFQDIINSTLEYIKQYSPEEVFILFPNIERLIGFVDDRYIPRIRKSDNVWSFNEGWLSDIFKMKISFKFKTYRKFDKHEPNELFAHFILQLKLLEEVCHLKNIKLFYSTWAQGDFKPGYLDLHDELIRYIDNNPNEINRHVQVSFNSKDEMRSERERTGLQYKKSDGHYGELFHNKWAEEFFNAYITVC